MNNNLYSLIDFYIKHRFPVFPVYGMDNGFCSCRLAKQCEHPGKHPWTAHGFKDATLKKDLIAKLFDKRKNPNIGLRTGEISGSLVVDIDPKHNGFESIKRIGKSWPPTPIALTGSGGEHRIMKYPVGLSVSSFSDLLPGVDIRANGGYIVAPPSLHFSGQLYKWDKTMNLQTVGLAEVPDWILEIISKRHNSNKNIRKKTNWPTFTRSKFGEGQRHDAIIRLAGYLAGKRIDIETVFYLIDSFNKTNCSPPLPSTEVFEIVKYVGGKLCTGDLGGN